MTTEELFNEYKHYTALTEGYYDYLVDEEDFKEALIDFARYHVNMAVSEIARIESNSIEEANADKEYLLEMYPLENIK